VTLGHLIGTVHNGVNHNLTLYKGNNEIKRRRYNS
jgi:hypothetical protein